MVRHLRKAKSLQAEVILAIYKLILLVERLCHQSIYHRRSPLDSIVVLFDVGTEGFVVDYQTETEFNNLRTMVFSNLEREWSISNMAEIVNLSESRFYVLYKAVFKTTPNQDLIMARIDYAKRLLSQNRTIAILDVAQKCGYANEFHFIRIFKKNVGVTPKKYAIMQWINVTNKIKK